MANKTDTKLRLSRRAILKTAVVGGAGLWLGLSGQALAHTVTARDGSGPYGIEDFFNSSGTKGVALSPSGERFAVLEQAGEGQNVRSKLVIYATSEPEIPLRQIDLGPLEVGRVEWSGDKYLLVAITIPAVTRSQRVSGSNRRVNVEGYATHRIVSVNTVDNSMVVMFQNERERLRYSPYLSTVTDYLPQDPEHILMPAYEADGRLSLYKMSVATGEGERIEQGSGSTVAWVTHNGVPVMRRNINARGTVETWTARLPGEAEWRFVRRNRIREAPDFAYVGDADAPDAVRVVMRAEGENYQSVRDLNLRDLSLSQAIGYRAGEEAIGGAYDSHGKWLGVRYYGERLEYEFEDAGLAAHHRALNQFFDNDCDVRLVDVSADRNRMIAFVAGPRDPGTWIFYDRVARNVQILGSMVPLDPERMSPGQRIQVQTRDGVKIEAYLTGPASQAPGPLVVLPHGGPEVRDYRRYDRQAQIFAAQGWWVLQPNFRGSGGYGAEFARAGWRRWDSRMQEDVEDAVAQVISEKGLDANRVAIMGTSYGGYAALMGAVRRPDLYKAAISICGVSDLVEILQWEKRTDDTPDKFIFEIWTNRIGDLDTDRELIQRGSPRLRVDEIRCPVLLVHGVKDEIVPVNQSQIMDRALRRAGKQVEYVEIDGGHADWDDVEELALMKRYVALLSQAFA